MNKFVFEKRVDSCFFLLAIVAMLVTIVANFLALRNNLTFSDEGWYMCLMRDLPHRGASRFHLLFGDLFGNDIYANRVACWLAQIIGSFVLAFGLYLWVNVPVCFSNKKPLSFLFLWGVLYLGQMSIVPCPSFNYITLNKIIIEVALGFVFIGLSKQKQICFVLSGFAIAFLFPVMITNTILIPLLYILILLMSTRKWRDVIGFTAGIILFFVYYFVFVESPNEVVTSLIEQTSETVQKGNSEYGFKWLLLGEIESLMYLAKCFFIAVALYGAYYIIIRRNCFSCKKRRQLIILAMLSVVILLYAWMHVSPVFMFPYKECYSYHWQYDLYWVFLFLLLLANLMDGKMQKKELIIICLLSLCPLCLAFGSNNQFYYRGASYFVFVAPALVYLAYKQSFIWRTALMLVFGLCFCLFLLQIIGGRNWEGQKYFGNDHIPVNSIGVNQNLRIEQRWIDELKSCQKHIPQGRVLCSCRHWGLACLLNYEPICYDYAVEKNDDVRFKTIIDEELDRSGSVRAVYYNNIEELDFVEKMSVLSQSGDYNITADTMGMTVYSLITRE